MDNPEGYWEPKELILTNHRVLDQIGDGWKATNQIAAEAFKHPAAITGQKKIREILADALNSGDQIIIKDPRLCRLFPLYHPILVDLFSRILLIQVIRNPEDVARSLAYRSTIPDIAPGAITDPDHARMLWLRYHLDALQWLELEPIHTIRYDAWLEDQNSEAEKLWNLVRHRFPDAALQQPSPQIRAPRFGTKEIGQSNQETYSAMFTARCFQQLSAGSPDWDGGFADKAFKLSVPQSGQGEASSPSQDLIAAAQWNHASTLLSAAEVSPGAAIGREQIVFVSNRPQIPCHIYRVKNMVDTLNKHGIAATWLRSEQALAEPRTLRDARLVVVHRSFWDTSIEALYQRCHELGIPTISDIDDLIFDEALIDRGEIEFIAGLDGAAVAGWRDKVKAFRKTLFAADFSVVSTQAIADHLTANGQPAACIPNGYGDVAARLSEHWRQQFQSAGEQRRVVYASGSPTHDSDFAIVVQPLVEFLGRHLDWTLSLVGNLDMERFPELAAHPRVECRPLVPHTNLHYEIARADINLIPLTRNRFNDAKSPLKWYEAALCGVPSIATNNPLYAELLAEDRGLLAVTGDDWAKGLDYLAASKERRDAIAECARQAANDRFGPRAIAEDWRNLLSKFVSHGWPKLC
ncbi:glycosyltransferase family protein [Allochromatium palmeri]|uniref:glycosyltransferase family protein n=1 Tax=Allochromatium palmeri TaxID=231048 RepID=UPI0016424AD1